MDTTLLSLCCVACISNTIVVQLLFPVAPNELSMAESTDLVDGLTRLDENVIASGLKDMPDEFFKRCACATPQEIDLLPSVY